MAKPEAAPVVPAAAMLLPAVPVQRAVRVQPVTRTPGHP